MAPEHAFRVTVFLCAWVLLCAATLTYFRIRRDAAHRVRSVPWFSGGFAIVLLWGAWFLGLPPVALVVLAPTLAWLTWSNTRAVLFCSQCGAYNFSKPPFAEAAFCRKCGAALKKSPL